MDSLINAGRLRHLLTIERPVNVVDSYGDAITGWEKFVEIRGSLSPISGRELFLASQYETEIKAKAAIRYYPGITPDMRLKHAGLSYNIVFIQNVDMRNRWINIFLSQGLRD